MLRTPAREGLRASQVGRWYGGAEPRSGAVGATLSKRRGPAPRGATRLKEAQARCRRVQRASLELQPAQAPNSKGRTPALTPPSMEGRPRAGRSALHSWLYSPFLQPEARPLASAEAFPLRLARRQSQFSRDPTLRLSREEHSAPIGCEG